MPVEILKTQECKQNQNGELKISENAGRLFSAKIIKIFHYIIFFKSKNAGKTFKSIRVQAKSDWRIQKF